MKVHDRQERLMRRDRVHGLLGSLRGAPKSASPTVSPGPGPEQSLRVGVVVPTHRGGGAEFVAGQWVDDLRRHGHSATLITTHESSSPDESPVLEDTVNLPGPHSLFQAWRLRQHVTAVEYDVIVALMPHWNLLALLATFGLHPRPAVVISGRNVECNLREVQGRLNRLKLWLAQRLYPRADGFVAISHPVAAEAVSAYGIPASRIWVVPNPSTAKVPLALGTSHKHRAFPNDMSRVTLTVPARMVAQKRPEVAVETAAILSTQYKVATSVEYFGTGPQRPLIERTAERLGVPVAFHGWQDQWFTLVAPDSIVLLPSLAEGFGNVLVEAAAVGIPSVSSSRALGVADAIVPNVTGVLCMGSDAQDFAAAVMEARKLAPVSAPNWLARFSCEQSGRQLREVLHSVVAARVSTKAAS